MTARTERLRRDSLDAIPSISGERAAITTAFYKAQMGRHSIPVLRAMNFYAICDRKALWMGDGELIVGERGPAPKAVPTYPELTCHSAEDLRILDSRPKTQYKVDPAVIAEYEREIIPFWRGRSLRDQMFAELPQEWLDAYAAGCFTEFMEQRAPGPHRRRRQALPQGDARLQSRHRAGARRPSTSSATPRPSTSASSCGPCPSPATR